MKVVLRDLLQSIDALRSLAQIKFKATLSFKVVKLLKEAEVQFKDYEEIRQQKVKQYNLADAPSESASQEEKDLYLARRNVADSELNVLLDSEVEMYDLKLKASDFDGQEISSAHLMLLHWLVQDEEA